MAASRKTKKAKKTTVQKTTLQKTTRAVSGRILPPVDITNINQLGELDKRLSIGPVTLVFVYADWCGHCKRYKPNMNELEGLNNRSVQIARIRDDMFPKSSINKTPIEGYPSLLLIGRDNKPVTFEKEDGETTTVIPDHTNMENMNAIVANAGTPEGLQLLNKGNVKPSIINKVNGTPVIEKVKQTTNTVVETAVPSQKQTSLNNYITTTPNNNNISPERPNSSESPDRATGSTIVYTPLVSSKTPAIPPNIMVDRLTANKMTVAKNLVETASNPISQEGKKQQGGNYGLLNMLTKVAYELGPAAALLYMANMKASSGSFSSTKKNSRKTRRFSRRR